MPVGSHNRQLGRRGEDLAADWYVEHGYAVVDRNWRCREGELDIVASRPGVVVFCEVKARSSDRFGLPAEAVGPRKQATLRRLAVRWLRAHPGPDRRDLRFDVCAVTPQGVEVIEEAF